MEMHDDDDDIGDDSDIRRRKRSIRKEARRAFASANYVKLISLPNAVVRVSDHDNINDNNICSNNVVQYHERRGISAGGSKPKRNVTQRNHKSRRQQAKYGNDIDDDDLTSSSSSTETSASSSFRGLNLIQPPKNSPTQHAAATKSSKRSKGDNLKKIMPSTTKNDIRQRTLVDDEDEPGSRSPGFSRSQVVSNPTYSEKHRHDHDSDEVGRSP